MERKKLLIADDSEMNRAILANILDQDYEIIEAADGREAIAALQVYHGEISALLLDIIMPEMDGFAVLEEMRAHGWLEEVPVIMISTETGTATIDHAFALGASDYISRPFATRIIRRRIINTILLNAEKHRLMDIVAERFLWKERNSDTMVAILGYALETRCGEGGTHMNGVGHLTKLLLLELRKKTDRYTLEPDDIELISIAAGLHDIGKILIPENILKKPGKLTAEEFELVKQHATIGAQLVAEIPVYQDEALVKYSIEICLRHHERWNGEGYPDGLRGDECPIAAQAVALADVYDALTTRRSYKEAYSHEKALAMIHAGECGSFNPLLLECLDDLSDVIRREGAARDVGQHPHNKYAITEELYRNRDMAAARMTRQLEEANAREDFFTGMSREMWFKYTVQPSSLRLSLEATQQTGLPAVMVDPLQSQDFLAFIGKETIETVRQQLARMTADESYAEMPVTLLLNGQPCRCRLAMFLSWSAVEKGRCRSLFGKVINVDENYTRLEDYDRTSIPQVEQQALLPLTAVDGVLRVSGRELAPILQAYRQMFQIVRLVDPGICMQVIAADDGHTMEKVERCYSIWDKTQRCRHCVSQEVVRTRRTLNKVDAIGSDLYYILAMCVEVDGFPYSLECVNPIYSDDVLSDENENLLNQLLMRNRQVYTDSLTKVFNRRYCDERLRRLSGEYALAMIDIDNLKQINDCLGHPAGDTAIYHTAQAIRAILRSQDELVRYGGDEFLLLFHSLPQNILRRKLEDICRAVRALRVADLPELRITVSIGGVYAAGQISELVEKADLALYRAKAQKDSAVLYEEDFHDSE